MVDSGIHPIRSSRPTRRVGARGGMNHLILIQLLISGGAGLAALCLYYLYSLFNPSTRLSYFLALQLSIVFIIGLNVFHTYALANIVANRTFLVISYCCSLAWAPCFILFTGLFFTGMGGRELSATSRRWLLAFGLAVGSLSFIPFAFARSIESILAFQKVIYRCAIIPLCGATQVAFSAVFFHWARKGDNAVHTVLARCVLSLGVLTTIACTLAVNVSIAMGDGWREIDLLVMDFYFLAWNIICVAVFFGFNRIFLEKMKEAGRSRRVRVERPVDESMANDWEIIEGAVVGKRLFLKPQLDLSNLSRETRIPRNRVSAVVNRFSGKPFNDYVNSLRIAEFKRIVQAKGNSGNILAAAFDAGFNSKATFYEWFRKIERESPGDYLKRTSTAEELTAGESALS
jgi:AraC-like DNA-binding protein